MDIKEKQEKAKLRKLEAEAVTAELKQKKLQGKLYDDEDMKIAIAESMEILKIHFCPDCVDVLNGIIKNCK